MLPPVLAAVRPPDQDCPPAARFSTPAAATVAFVAPSILIGVVATAFTTPGSASSFLGPYGILGLWVVVPVIGVARC